MPQKMCVSSLLPPRIRRRSDPRAAIHTASRKRFVVLGVSGGKEKSVGSSLGIGPVFAIATSGSMGLIVMGVA